MRAALDGSEITPLQAGSEHLLFPLTGGSGLRSLRLRWVYYVDREPLDSPRLEKPRLENLSYPPGEPRRPTLWTIHIPPGYRLALSHGTAVRSNRIERHLQRAAAELLASSLLAPHAAGMTNDSPGHQLLNAQVHFYRDCREVEYELTFSEWPREGAASREDLAARLQKLQADNRRLSQTEHFEWIRTQAEAQSSRPRISPDGPSEHPMTQQGTPIYWQVSNDSRELRVRLIAVRTEETRLALGYSALLLILLLIAWMLPAYPRAVTWLWVSWPEQVALLGGLAWLAWGANLLSVLLLMLALAVRLFYLGHWLVLRLRRPEPATGSGAASAT
jgi:hypothetical protein